jgi:hypothetical protein
VLRAEHLAAMAVQTGRDKDRQRVGMLLEQAPLDSEYLSAVLARLRPVTKFTFAEVSAGILFTF